MTLFSVSSPATDDEDGRREAVVQLIRIGYERVEGYVDGGMQAWKAAALPTSLIEGIDLETFYKRWFRHEPFVTLDVRRSDEWAAGHIPGAEEALFWPCHYCCTS